MAVFYRKYQDNRKTSGTYGKWYGRSVILENVSTKAMAREISHSTTVTYSDVLAVITELAEVMKNHLQSSHKVTIDGIGSFKVGLRTLPADTSADFGAQNVIGYRVNYQPEKHFVPNGEKTEKGNRKGSFVKDLLDGISSKEAPKNAVTDEPAADAKAGA